MPTEVRVSYNAEFVFILGERNSVSIPFSELPQLIDFLEEVVEVHDLEMGRPQSSFQEDEEFTKMNHGYKWAQCDPDDDNDYLEDGLEA
jgi:hypothetical protein